MLKYATVDAGSSGNNRLWKREGGSWIPAFNFSINGPSSWITGWSFWKSSISVDFWSSWDMPAGDRFLAGAWLGLLAVPGAVC